MSTQKRFTRVVLPILMLLVVTGTAGAKRPGTPPAGSPDFLLQNPQDRMVEWRDGLLKFIAEHPDLTNEQFQAVQSLADLDDPSFFASTLAPNRRELLAKRLDELGRVLSFADTLDLLRSFGELGFWLAYNKVDVGVIIAKIPKCNCDDAQDCAGGACNNVECVHEAGTTHSGRCAGSAALE